MMFIETERTFATLAMRALWVLLAAMVGLAAYFAMRTYLSPELLLYFANGVTC